MSADETGRAISGQENRYRVDRLSNAALRMVYDSLRLSLLEGEVVLCGEPFDKRETAADFMNSIYQSGGHSDRRKASFEDTDRLPYSTLFRVISSGNKRIVLMNLSHYLDMMP